MPIQTFSPPIQPSFGGQQTPEMAVLVADFGDGYGQRAPDGINSIKRVFTFEWAVLLNDEADTIENFFLARKGAEAFLWTPPGYDDPLKLICQRYTRTRNDYGRSRINATFRQVFDL